MINFTEVNPTFFAKDGSFLFGKLVFLEPGTLNKKNVINIDGVEIGSIFSTNESGRIQNETQLFLSGNYDCQYWKFVGTQFDIEDDTQFELDRTVRIIDQTNVSVKIGGNGTVPTIAALRDIDNEPEEGTTITVMGYYKCGDMTPQTYYWNSYYTEQDNGGNVIKPLNRTSSGRWVMVPQKVIDVRSFGVMPTYSSEEAPVSITSAVGFANAMGRDLWFPHIEEKGSSKIYDTYYNFNGGNFELDNNLIVDAGVIFNCKNQTSLKANRISKEFQIGGYYAVTSTESWLSWASHGNSATSTITGTEILHADTGATFLAHNCLVIKSAAISENSQIYNCLVFDPDNGRLIAKYGENEISLNSQVLQVGNDGNNVWTSSILQATALKILDNATVSKNLTVGGDIYAQNAVAKLKKIVAETGSFDSIESDNGNISDLNVGIVRTPVIHPREDVAAKQKFVSVKTLKNVFEHEYVADINNGRYYFGFTSSTNPERYNAKEVSVYVRPTGNISTSSHELVIGAELNKNIIQHITVIYDLRNATFDSNNARDYILKVKYQYVKDGIVGTTIDVGQMMPNCKLVLQNSSNGTYVDNNLEVDWSAIC